jgi:hypothetical protein
MSMLNDRATLEGYNLGSVANLHSLTAAIEAITRNLEQAAKRGSRAELLEFRRTLDTLNAILIKLRSAARQRIAALSVEYARAI